MQYHRHMPYKDPEAQRKYQREWMARRRKEWFEQNGPCVDCGSNENLELDHVDRRFKVSHRIWSWSAARREAELAKCVARCSPCHDGKTLVLGEYTRGESHGNSVLTGDQVRILREARKNGESIATLAREMGVNRITANHVASGQTWKWMK